MDLILTSPVLPGASRASLPRMIYRVGDVLRISCPFTPTVVTGVDEAYVSVRWPWWEIDPDAEGVRWNGEVALGRADPDELYMTDPASPRLAPGDTCRVGIPARIIHVIEVHEYEPPQEAGWLPRPSLSLLVLRVGEAPDVAAEFQGTSIEPDGGVPFPLELLFRPYAFLEVGDDVADAAGRAWRFDGPWTWTAYDGAGECRPGPWPYWSAGRIRRQSRPRPLPVRTRPKSPAGAERPACKTTPSPAEQATAAYRHQRPARCPDLPQSAGRGCPRLLRSGKVRPCRLLRSPEGLVVGLIGSPVNLYCRAVDVDWNAELVDQLEWHWRHQLRPRLDGLTDDEYFWQPVPGSWTLSRRGQSSAPMSIGAGEFTLDYASTPHDRAPVTTIAWRLGAPPRRVRATDRTPLRRLACSSPGRRLPGHRRGSTATARRRARCVDPRCPPPRHSRISSAPRRHLTAGVRGCTDGELVLHVHREVIHHGAEISLLRDLYLWKGSGGHL